MKKIRQISANPIVILLVVFNFIFVSCNRNDVNADLEVKNEYSGKTLFNEIVFATTNNLNLDHVNVLKLSLDKLSNTEKIEYQRTIKMIDEQIAQIDPHYFDNFKNSIYSRNHIKINESIEGINTMMEKAIMNIPELRDSYLLGMKIAKNVDIKVFTNADGTLNKEAFKEYLVEEYGEGSNESQLCGPTFCAAAVYVAIAVSAAAAVNVAAFAFCYYWVRNNCNSNKVNFNNSQLRNEILVNQLYEAL